MKREKLKVCEMSVLLTAALNKNTFNRLTESGTPWDSWAINQREMCLLNNGSVMQYRIPESKRF